MTSYYLIMLFVEKNSATEDTETRKRIAFVFSFSLTI